MAKRKRKERRAASAPEAQARPATPRVPGWVPAAVFSVLTLWLFRAFVFSGQMLTGSDTLGLGYVARAFYAHALRDLGTFPRWNPQILGGTPFLEALSGGDALYPPSLLLLLVMQTYRALGWKLVVHVLAAGFFMFGWVRTLRASRAAALVAGTGYMLAPFFVSLVLPGHDGRIFVTALTPLLFWVVERHFVRPRVTSFAGVALVVGLVILTTHFETAYFLFGGVGAYAIFRTVQMLRTAGEGGAEPNEASASSEPARRARGPALARFGLFLAASVFGAGLAGVQLIPAAQYVTSSSRRIQTTREEAGDAGPAWSSSWSMHPEEAMSLLIPEFVGNAADGDAAWTQGTYWGRNAFKNNHEYAGLVILLLAAVSFTGAALPAVRYFFAGLGAVALLFALGTHTPVWGLFYAVVPGISLFRAPSQAIFLFGFAAATLAALGVDRLLAAAAEDSDEAWRLPARVLWIGGGAMAVLALLASSGALTSIWTATVYRGVDERQLGALAALRPFIGRGAWLAAFLALGTAGLSWAVRRSYLAPTALLVGLVALVALDEARVDAPFVQVMDFDAWARPAPTVQALLDRESQNPEPYRLLSMGGSPPGQDVRPALFGIELAGGHHPNDLSRYRELIGMVGSNPPMNLLRSQQIRRLLNVRYVLWPDFQIGPPQLSLPIVTRSQLRDGRVYQTLQAENGLPRARLVARSIVKSDDEAVPYMLSEAFDPDGEVVLPEEPPIPLDGGPVDGSVTWEERGLNRLRLSVTSDRAALLVVADNWYPAWHATVDGADAPVLRAYHSLRAVPVPAGEHTVEMTYRSSVVSRALQVSVVLLIGLLGAVSWQLWQDRRATAGEAS